MAKLEHIAANDYPRTMVRLCDISYFNSKKIPVEVKKLGLEVVWGPEELHTPELISYSLAYVCRRKETNEYMVVIRGTLVESLKAWFSEDFDIGAMQPFYKLAPHAPDNALISQGTYNGMIDLLKMTDKHKMDITTFLREANPAYIYVTGHSLGGTLTPPMFACLNDTLYGGGPVQNMALWSFAGLTPGNNGFNTYLKSLMADSLPGFKWRYYNTIDIAPNCWWSLENIQNIYTHQNLHWKWPENDVIKELFKKAEGNGYIQPEDSVALNGEFNDSFWDEHVWGLQAVHQHIAPTYVTLIDKAFPL